MTRGRSRGEACRCRLALLTRWREGRVYGDVAGPRLHGRVHNEWAAALVFRDAIDRGRATVWDVAEAYRSPACRVGGRGVFHDHAYCGEVAAPAPVPVRREAGAVVVVASAVVLLAAWAFVRLRCATRARRRH